MLRNINLRSLLIFRTLLFKTLQSPFIMPKLTIPERTLIVEKYFETKIVVAVLRQFQIAFPGRNLHRAFGVVSTNTGCMH